MRVCAVGCALLVACAHAPVKPAPIVDSEKWVETESLPRHPKEEPLPDGIRDDERMVVPIEEGMCDPDRGGHYEPPCPEFSGIAVSESRAFRDAQYRIRYEELRKRYEADRSVWSAHRELYETQIQRDRDHIENLRPSWWEQHDGQVLGVAGFVVGSLLTVGLAAAVNKAEN